MEKIFKGKKEHYKKIKKQRTINTWLFCMSRTCPTHFDKSLRSQFITAIKATKLPLASYQETYREEWSFNDYKITIDEWSELPIFVEIEENSELIVMETARILHCDIDYILIESVDVIYEKTHNSLPLIINKLHTLTFNTIDKVLKSLKIC